MPEALRLVIRTPHAVVLEAEAESVRVPSETGQVGLRPRQESGFLAVEPGLIVFRDLERVRFAATAGGLLDKDRERAVLHTPFAVIGDAAEDVLAALDQALAAPDRELAARRRLGELEQRIVEELRHGAATPRGQGPA